MDPVSTILAALAAGAVAATKDTASAVIKDAYEALKATLKKKLADRPVAVAALEAHASDPEGADAALAPALRKGGALDDADVLAAARQLLAAADEGGTVARRYGLVVNGDVQGLVQGDRAQVTMNFGAPPPQAAGRDGH
jgi:hypothetical protein